MKSIYPRVRCDRHRGPPIPGYVVCKNVTKGAKVAIHIRPTATELGQLLCGEKDHKEDSADPPLLTCAHCTRKWIPN